MWRIHYVHCFLNCLKQSRITWWKRLLKGRFLIVNQFRKDVSRAGHNLERKQFLIHWKWVMPSFHLIVSLLLKDDKWWSVLDTFCKVGCIQSTNNHVLSLHIKCMYSNTYLILYNLEEINENNGNPIFY